MTPVSSYLFMVSSVSFSDLRTVTTTILKDDGVWFDFEFDQHEGVFAVTGGINCCISANGSSSACMNCSFILTNAGFFFNVRSLEERERGFVSVSMYISGSHLGLCLVGRNGLFTPEM